MNLLKNTTSALRLLLVMSAAAPLIVSCQGETATSVGTPGLELQSEDYRNARSHFQTQLVRQGAAPQPGEPLHAPVGATQVMYSPASSLRAWISPNHRNTKLPAVLFLHGGFAIGEEDWTMARPYEQAGYVVMMPVLRGENGQAGSYSMFYNEVSDVMAAVNYLSQVPYVDASHIYLAGHSVGGTLVQLCALTSSRFKAAASFSGAPDPVSWSKGQPEVVPFDGSQIKEFQMRSSLAFATSFKCPIQLYYGDKEAWCDAVSQETAERAKDKGLDVEAVSVPGDHFSAVPEEIKQSLAFFQSHR